ncbi:hypothetical protein K450DRAFT_244083 [Umbelopsis ramanniana AG]|uniref:Transmembrane protein n=1 Tax=Umbelopsis ramanniana AG TaxID=1314678 RepID=A0AAD5E8Z7_UMBRA|nr:uncharacterized protein K450DRAFT_244083 [Umbelopsis ramanniana AG]KAI8578922.1 hypothetical protein K450DRAFT_244083 [Umbelopsis ramanniana AG]
MQWLPAAISMLLILLGETYGAVTPSSSSINVSQTSSIVPAITFLAASTAPSFVPVPQPTSTIDTNGFSDDSRDNQNQQSWLQQHSRWVFVLVIGLLVGAIILYYIVRGITRARRELRAENEKLALGPMHMGPISSPPKYEEATSGR